MASLSIFPPEILERMTSMVFTSQQMRLWLCGDRTLNIKLKNGGLKQTSICWSSSSWMPWSRSFFTALSGLEDVEWGVDIGTSLCPTLEFNHLPQTLKRLYLACDDVFLLMKRQNVNMNELLPLLHSLSLSGTGLHEENLKNLPSNLVELHVTSVHEVIESSSIFRDLPRTLHDLKLLFKIADLSEHENDLPSDLISLRIYSLSSSFNWFSKLPKSLKVLNVEDSRFKRDYLSLPSQLEELELFSISNSGLPQLPQSLKTLKLTLLQDPSKEELALLPMNLTRFHLSTEGIHHSVLQRLPASLTDFDVPVFATHPDILSFFHPASRTISIGAAAVSAGDVKIFPLPTNLQSFRIHQISDDMCAILPPGLQKLQIDGGLLTTKGTSKLPKSIKSLTSIFECFDDYETMSHLGYIPNLSLRAREAFSECKVTEDWISALLPSASANLEGHIPTLTSLQIRGDQNWRQNLHFPYITESFFVSLQKFKNLTSLKTSFCAEISCDWLRLIPQTVTNLDIHFISAFPTESQLLSLPRNLKYLNLEVRGVGYGPCDWKDESLRSLPRSLQTFLIEGSFPNLTHRMYEYLPPCLQTTSPKFGGPGSEFVPPLNRLHRA